MTLGLDKLKQELKQEGLEFTPAQITLIAAGETREPTQANNVKTITELYTIQSLRKMVSVLVESNEQLSEASGKFAKQLVFATWALVGATVVLAIITALMLLKNGG